MKLNFKLPAKLSIGLGVALGIVGALNITSFGFGSPWTELVTFACAGAASLGVAPLTHGALRNVLHITYPQALAIAGLATTACTAVTAASAWSDTVKGLVVGVLTAAVGVLAGPDAATGVVAPPEPAPAAPAAPVPPAPAPSRATPAPKAKAPSTRRARHPK